MAVNEIVLKSPISAAMGARIQITGPGRGLYLVIGHGAALDAPVKTAGGVIVLRLNGRKMLVTLPFTGYLSLRNNSRIANIGPVTVDIKRLTKLAEILAKAKSPKPGSTG